MDAIQSNDLTRVEQMLQENPEVDVNAVTPVCLLHESLIAFFLH